MTSWFSSMRDELCKLSDVRTELKPHQTRVVERMKSQSGLVVAHGLGSGKTLSSIAAQDALGLRADVIVPASLQENYAKERRKHLKGVSPEAAITSMQRVAREGASLGAPMVIVDEAHRAREINTKTYQALKAALQPAEKRMLLTASPFYNRPSDIAPLVNLAAGKSVLRADPQEFHKRYVRERKVSPGLLGTLKGMKPGVVEELNPERKGELKGAFNEWVDYHPNSSENFPEVERTTVSVPMTKKQLEVYDGVIGAAPAWVAWKIKRGLPPSKQESKDLNAFATAVRQISLSTRAHAPKVPPQEPKIEMAFENMKKGLESDKNFKGVVYSNYLDVGLNPYKERLEAAGIPYGEFTGQLSKNKRDQLIRDYNDGEKRVLLISSAGGEGLDLKGTKVLQVMEPHWNAEKLKQVEGRAIRFGSHAHLPEPERKVRIENYLSTRPRSGVLEALHFRKPGGGADEYLTTLSQNKEKLIGQFRGLMEERHEPKQ